MLINYRSKYVLNNNWFQIISTSYYLLVFSLSKTLGEHQCSLWYSDFELLKAKNSVCHFRSVVLSRKFLNSKWSSWIFYCIKLGASPQREIKSKEKQLQSVSQPLSYYFIASWPKLRKPCWHHYDMNSVITTNLVIVHYWLLTCCSSVSFFIEEVCHCVTCLSLIRSVCNYR